MQHYNQDRKYANRAKARANEWSAFAKRNLAHYKRTGDALYRDFAITAARQYRRNMKDVTYYTTRAQR